MAQPAQIEEAIRRGKRGKWMKCESNIWKRKVTLWSKSWNVMVETLPD